MPQVTGVESVTAEILGVSRETFEKLSRYVDLLLQWQARINLISPTTVNAIWTRHILDSTQLFHLKPAARHWVDLGSGGGLPGLVLACCLAESEGGMIDLVESNGKKAAFLRHVAVTLGLPVQVHAERIESVLPKLDHVDVVTARALAPLGQLIGYSSILLKKGATALFLKGREAEQELTEAAKEWQFSIQSHPSQTDPKAAIVEIRLL